MGNLCMTDDRSSRLKKRRERERLVANKYRSFQTNPDEQRSSDNGDQLEIGFAQSEHCHRCKCKWNVVRRRHHCRRCKHSFCSNHSSRTTSAVAILQEKGLKDDNIQTAGNPTVRVCDNCFYRLARKSDGQASWQWCKMYTRPVELKMYIFSHPCTFCNLFVSYRSMFNNSTIITRWFGNGIQIRW